MSSDVQRIAILSVHACPTTQLGLRDSGGMNVYVHHLAQELAAQGLAVDIFTRRHDQDDPEVVEMAPGARLVHLDAGPPEAPKESLFGHLPAFRDGLLRFAADRGLRYDVVHSHYWLSGVVGMDLASRWGVPHATTFHTLARSKTLAGVGEREPVRRHRMESRIAAEADAVIVSAPYERDLLARHFDVPPERVRVVPCGVDTTLFRPMGRAHARALLGLDGLPVALFVGRLDPVKGADILLEAVAGMASPENTQVLVVGGDAEREPEAARLHGLSQELGLGDRARFEGTIPHEDLPLYYSAADVLVMPSYVESFGLAALEAMACGTPVVATRVGGLASLVKDGGSGYLVPWHCPEPFTHRLEMLLSHPGLRDSMGEAARRQAQEHSWSAVARTVATVYGGLRDRSGG